MYSSARLPLVQTLPLEGVAGGGGGGGGGGDFHNPHHHHLHHHHHHHSHGPTTTTLPLDGTNLPGDACLVLTTDPKPRLRWTAELHERFVDAVTQLGGPDSLCPFFNLIFFFFFFFVCTN